MKKNRNVRRLTALQIRQNNVKFWENVVQGKESVEDFREIKDRKLKLARREVEILIERTK